MQRYNLFQYPPNLSNKNEHRNRPPFTEQLLVESEGQVFDSSPNITWQMPVPPMIMFHNHYMFDAKVGI